MRRSTFLTTLLLAIILPTGGGCPSPRPDAPAGDDSRRDDPRRDDPGADKYLCHDLDGDGFSFVGLALEGGLQPGPLAGLECSFWPASRVHPWALEIPNGIDDNCNGWVDEPAECLPKFPAITDRY